MGRGCGSGLACTNQANTQRRDTQTYMGTEAASDEGNEVVVRHVGPATL